VVDIAKVTTDTGVPHDISDIFHGEGTVIRRDGAGFSDGVDVSHVSDGRSRDTVDRAHVFVDFFIFGHVSGDKVLLVFVWVIGSTSAGKGVFGDRSEGFDGFADSLAN